jgi:pimeloyl-ACP methyl ester carboxylesterase
MSLPVRKSLSAIGSVIYWPGDTAPRGGVVCLHGSEGGSAGWNDLNCAVLAASGFAAVAYRYTESRPFSPQPDIDNIPLEGTGAALTCLREVLAPHGCGIGLFGASRGAEQALLLVQLLPEEASPTLPDAVAVHSPPDATWPAFIVAISRRASRGRAIASVRPGHGAAGMSARAPAHRWRSSVSPIRSLSPKGRKTKFGATRWRADWLLGWSKPGSRRKSISSTVKIMCSARRLGTANGSY